MATKGRNNFSKYQQGNKNTMTEEKFYSEVATLEKFFSIYCENKHCDQYEKEYILEYKNSSQTYTLNLCKECHKLINYSFTRLLECPHEIKPRCRKCPQPCYEKKEWKQLAKLMRYSGFQFGLIKIKNTIKKAYDIFPNGKKR
jgi:hypothetical protein